MSANNGVIRIGRKGLKKFAFGEEGTPGSEPFQVDVVVAMQQWFIIDENFRPIDEDSEGNRSIPLTEMPAYHIAVQTFATNLATANGANKEPPTISVGEALDFIARLREAYNELAVFFRPKSLQERELPATSEAELRFSAEE